VPSPAERTRVAYAIYHDDYGVDMMRDRMQSAVQKQRST
jgi:hypothetical protein